MTNSRVLVCGDSFCVTDSNFKNLHWTEKIYESTPPTFELINMAYGGCSNAMIVLQLLQGLTLNPNFVIISFTNESRYEIDKDLSALPTGLTGAELAHYQKQRYTTNMRNKDKHFDLWVTTNLSNNFEKLKNYFYISFCLQILKEKNIGFAFSLGGFEFKQDYCAWINSNYIPNFIKDHVDSELKTNLWFHTTKGVATFHVEDDKVQTLFANECIAHLAKLNII
jgi:hypothetical protein